MMTRFGISSVMVIVALMLGVEAFNLRIEQNFTEEYIGYTIATKNSGSSNFFVSTTNAGESFRCSLTSGSCRKINIPPVPIDLKTANPSYPPTCAYGSQMLIGQPGRTGYMTGERPREINGQVFQFTEGLDFTGRFDSTFTEKKKKLRESRCFKNRCATGFSMSTLTLENGREMIVVSSPLLPVKNRRKNSDQKFFTHVGGLHFYKMNRKDSQFNDETGTILKNRATIGELEYEDIEINSYLGYSVISDGDLNNDKFIDVVASAPRVDLNYGGVFIFYGTRTSIAARPSKKLTGDQPGAYFGASMALADFDNDSQNDLCVGSPLYYYNEADVGKVTCYIKGLAKENEISLFGLFEGEQFGSSLTTGDFDNDGFKDLVVGAPYYDERGRVLIFNGNKDGLSNVASQVIVGDTASSRFGYALSAFIFDQRYQLLIGAPRDSKVSRYVSLPVASLTVELSTNLVDNRLQDTATEFTCMFNLTNPSENIIPLGGIQFIVRLDPGLEPAPNFPIRALSPGDSLLFSHSVTILTREDSYRIETSWSNVKKNEYSLRSRGNLSRNMTVTYIRGCGPENSEPCTANLKTELSAEHPSPYSIVPGEFVNFTIKVSNIGPFRALRANFRFTVGDLSINDFKTSKFQCSKPLGESFLVCNMKIMEAGQDALVSVIVNTKKLVGNVTLTASAVSDTPHPEGVVLESSKTYHLSAIQYADASISSIPMNLGNHEIINSKIVKGRKAQQHKYTIRHTDLGFSPNSRKPLITEAAVNIYWPFQYLYPISAKASVGSCEQQYINCMKKEQKYRGIFTSDDLDDDCPSPSSNTSCMAVLPQFPLYSFPNNEVVPNNPNLVNCSNWNNIYVKILCFVPSLGDEQVATITIEWLPNTDSLANNETDINPYGYTWAPSFAVVTAKSESFFIEDADKQAALLNNFASTITFLEPASILLEIAEKTPVPIWLIIVATVGGVLLLTCITAALKKAGFFARKTWPPHLVRDDSLTDTDEPDEELGLNE